MIKLLRLNIYNIHYKYIAFMQCVYAIHTKVTNTQIEKILTYNKQMSSFILFQTK